MLTNSGFRTRTLADILACRTDVNGKRAIFSIWNAYGAQCSSVPGAICQPFTGQGDGYQTLIPYNWVVSHHYYVYVYADSPGWLGGWVYDQELGTWTLIGAIQVGTNWYIESTAVPRHGSSGTPPTPQPAASIPGPTSSSPRLTTLPTTGRRTSPPRPPTTSLRARVLARSSRTSSTVSRGSATYEGAPNGYYRRLARVTPPAS